MRVQPEVSNVLKGNKAVCTDLDGQDHGEDYLSPTVSDSLPVGDVRRRGGREVEVAEDSLQRDWCLGWNALG